NTRYLLDHRLVQLRIDVALAADDHVLLATQQHDASLLDAGQVPRPVLVDRGLAEVAGEEVRAAHDELPVRRDARIDTRHDRAHQVTIAVPRELLVDSHRSDRNYLGHAVHA